MSSGVYFLSKLIIASDLPVGNLPAGSHCPLAPASLPVGILKLNLRGFGI